MIVQEIINLSKALKEVEFTYCRRDSNHAAHETAKIAVDEDIVVGGSTHSNGEYFER